MCDKKVRKYRVRSISDAVEAHNAISKNNSLEILRRIDAIAGLTSVGTNQDFVDDSPAAKKAIGMLNRAAREIILDNIDAIRLKAKIYLTQMIQDDQNRANIFLTSSEPAMFSTPKPE